MQEIYDVIIIGSGPAGLTAGIYTSRANLKTLMIAGSKWGGQLMLTTSVENFPGFPEGIQGPDLMTNMRKQMERFGVEIKDEDVTNVDFSSRPFQISTQDSVLSAQAVIVATGAVTQWLNVPGEQELIGRGVSSCAPCDAPFLRKESGGGWRRGRGHGRGAGADKICRLRDDCTQKREFKASKIMQDKVLNNPKINVKWNTEVAEIVGKDKVEKVKFKDGSEMEADGGFCGYWA